MEVSLRTLTPQLMYPHHRPSCVRPCSHLLQTLLDQEIANELPRPTLSRASEPFLNENTPLPLQCRACCSKNDNCRILLVMLSRKQYDIALRTANNFSLVPKLPSSVYIIPPTFGIHDVDSCGYRVVATHLYRHIVLQEAMSWLSTLGGGFSCLGEKFEDAAEIAGQIAIRQMHLALAMKIPAFQARCRLFYAQSLMQCGKLKESAKIVRGIYHFSKTASSHDNPPEVHLSLMCQGVWSRLAYLWSLRRRKCPRRRNLEPAEVKTMVSTTQNSLEDGRLRGSGDNALKSRKLFPDIAAILDVL